MMTLRMKKELAQGDARRNRPSSSASAFSDSVCCGTNVMKNRNSSEKMQLYSELRLPIWWRSVGVHLLTGVGSSESLY